MSRTESNRYDVLLSYTPADAVLAEAVRERLTSAGLTCFAPLVEIEADEYQERLPEVLEQSRSFAPILSRSSISSQRLLVEAGAAWGVDLPVFLLLNDVRPAEVSSFFERYPAFPLWKGIPKLIEAVRKLPERQSA